MGWPAVLEVWPSDYVSPGRTEGKPVTPAIWVPSASSKVRDLMHPAYDQYLAGEMRKTAKTPVFGPGTPVKHKTCPYTGYIEKMHEDGRRAHVRWVTKNGVALNTEFGATDPLDMLELHYPERQSIAEQSDDEIRAGDTVICVNADQATGHFTAGKTYSVKSVETSERSKMRYLTFYSTDQYGGLCSGWGVERFKKVA